MCTCFFSDFTKCQLSFNCNLSKGITLRTFGHIATIHLGPTPFLSALISNFFFRPYKMSAARQLQLAKRENFFSDPLFKDIWSFEDGDLQKRLETFKNKSALAIPGKADTAHNLQVK